MKYSRLSKAISHIGRLPDDRLNVEITVTSNTMPRKSGLLLSSGQRGICDVADFLSVSGDEDPSLVGPDYRDERAGPKLLHALAPRAGFSINVGCRDHDMCR